MRACAQKQLQQPPASPNDRSSGSSNGSGSSSSSGGEAPATSPPINKQVVSAAMDSRLYAYLLDHTREPALLADLRRDTAQQFPSGARMQVSPEQGAFLGWLAGTLRAARVIEVGVFTGYSRWGVSGRSDDGMREGRREGRRFGACSVRKRCLQPSPRPSLPACPAAWRWRWRCRRGGGSSRATETRGPCSWPGNTGGVRGSRIRCDAVFGGAGAGALGVGAWTSERRWHGGALPNHVPACLPASLACPAAARRQQIEERLGPAAETLESLLADPLQHNSYDFAFIDADKKV